MKGFLEVIHLISKINQVSSNKIRTENEWNRYKNFETVFIPPNEKNSKMRIQ